MCSTLFHNFAGDEITEELLQETAWLFSSHYGLWGEGATRAVGHWAKAGTRVKMSKNRLRAECFPSDGDCSLVQVRVDSQLAGHAIASRWKCKEKTVCWVTQLVVHRNYRERGLAVALLTELRREGDDIYGIASSHPAACLAAQRAFGRGTIADLSTSFIRDHALEILDHSPVRYLKRAKLHGCIFDDQLADGTVSCVDTGFFVGHAEPLQALETVQSRVDWPLGELLDGFEFLLILESSPQLQ